MTENLRTHTILVVDDNEDNLLVLSSLLRKQYKVKTTLSGAEALIIACMEDRPDLILLDIMMPEMDGYEVILQLKSDPRTARIPVIFLTARSGSVEEEKGLKLGAVDYITKPIVRSLALQRIRTQVDLYDQNNALEMRVQERTVELHHSRLEIIQRLSTAAEFKDDDTGMHILRMSEYSALLADAAGLPPEEVETLKNAAPMHDVGKIGVPDAVLKKPGALTDEEWGIMRSHCAWGAKIIGEHDDPLLTAAATIALGHHEKWDGTGYPHQVEGEDIPFIARIVAIADVFDALTSKRLYKEAWPFDKAMALIKEEGGKHFDPALASLFLDLAPAIQDVMKRHTEK